MKDLSVAVQNRQAIADIQYQLKTGQITYDQAKLLVQPILDEINEPAVTKTKHLNKKYGLTRKPTRLDFVSAMRNSY